MSSFWQITIDNKKTQLNLEQKDSALPLLTNTTNIIKKKGSSKTLHENLPSVHSKLNILNKQSIKSNKRLKKQTQISIHCRSMYRLPTTNKQRVYQGTLLQFTNAILKIQDLFNQECNVICQSQDLKSKFKKTLLNKCTFSKLNQLQSLLQTNPKKQAKKQFQEILRIYNKSQLKISPYLKLIGSQMQSISNQFKEKSLNMLRKTKNTSISTYFNPIKQTKHYSRYSPIKQQHWASKKNLTKQSNISSFKQLHNSTLKQNEQSLSAYQKQQLYKQSKAFQKAQKHLILKTFTAKILYHHLTAQLAMQQSLLQQSLISLFYCQYYARKIDFQVYIIPCLMIQSEIKQALYQYNSAINILKTALQFSIVKKWKQLELRILEKISMVYYYRGNSYMAKYYKELSENGLPQYETEIYLKEYSKAEELKSLEARLFSLPFQGIKKKKHNQRYELDISRGLVQDHDSLILSHHQQVSQMLRSNKTSKVGIKLRKLIIQSNDKGNVKKFNIDKKSTQILPRFVSFQYPLQHCSQIIKSHLSKDRYPQHSQIKNVSFVRTLNFMKSLYQRLSYQVGRQRIQEMECEKQNTHRFNA